MNRWAEHRLRITNLVLMREFDGEMVFLHIDQATYYGLYGVGAVVGRELLCASSIQQAFDTLLDRFDLEAALLASEMNAFIQALCDRGLVEMIPTLRVTDADGARPADPVKEKYATPQLTVLGHIRELTPGTPIRRGRLMS